MAHAAPADPTEGEAGRWLTHGHRIEVPSHPGGCLAIPQRGHSGARVSRNTNGSAQGDRAHCSDNESTGSFHWLLLQLLNGNSSVPILGGPDDRSRPRSPGRRRAGREPPTPKTPLSPATRPATHAMRRAHTTTAI